MVSYQILKNNEKLQPVVIPPNFDWGHFYGWYIVELDLEKSKAATAAATGTEPYTGTRYRRTGNTYSETTSTTTTPQYMRDSNGVYIQLTRKNSYSYTYNNVEYNNQLYTRTENTDYSLQYEGTLYTKVNGAMVELAEGESYTGEVYGKDEDSYYEELRRRDEPTYTWKIGDEVYTGPRYTRSSKTGSMLTWTGLFGQTFAQNEYTWSTMNNFSWSGVGADGKTTTQTLLDGFTEGVNPYNLEQGSASGNNIIYHYKQQLDGKYTVEDRYTAYYSGSGENFNFSNKFDSFTVAGYSSSFNQNFNPDQPGTGEHKVGPGGSASLSGTIHIYHTRKKFTLTLASFTTANNSPDKPNDKEIEGIYYEQPLSFLTADELTPRDRENYTFGGWYYDKAFTKAVDFSKATMPDGELTLFAKWVLKYYFVEIDPAGGEMEDALEFSEYTGFDSPRNQPTYTWLQFGSKLSPYDSVERKYIPDNNGENMYVNVKFAQDFETASTKSRDYSLPPQCRKLYRHPEQGIARRRRQRRKAGASAGQSGKLHRIRYDPEYPDCFVRQVLDGVQLRRSRRTGETRQPDFHRYRRYGAQR